MKDTVVARQNLPDSTVVVGEFAIRSLSPAG